LVTTDADHGRVETRRHRVAARQAGSSATAPSPVPGRCPASPRWPASRLRAATARALDPVLPLLRPPLARALRPRRPLAPGHRE
jgi:hypothetical protein